MMSVIIKTLTKYAPIYYCSIPMMMIFHWVAWPDSARIRPNQRSEFCNYCNPLAPGIVSIVNISTETESVSTHPPAFLHWTSGVGLPLTEQTSSATSPVSELITTCNQCRGSRNPYVQMFSTSATYTSGLKSTSTTTSLSMFSPTWRIEFWRH